MSAELLGERLHAAAECFALVGESQRRTLLGELLRDPPRDRVIVGDPHDEAALAAHQLPHAVRPPQA